MNKLLAAGVAFGALLSALPAQLTKVVVATGFQNPLLLTTPPGDERLFVVEQPGRIKIIKNGTVLGTPFLDIVSKVNSGANERGLLGLAFHPNYAQNGTFFVSYNRSGDAASIVERYQVSGNPDVANASSGTVFFGPVSQPFSNHNGGNIVFGPDGYLYFGLGDGGSGGDPACNAQNRQSLLGKMLRLDVDTPGNRIPPTNPFVNDPNTRNEIWALGLRNPWRWSFDRANGDLYIGDVGQNSREEISFQPANSPGGENYGWKVMEGLNCFSTASCQAGVPPCNDARLTLPIHTYPTGTNCSITGGYVYRGCAIPSMQGSYFFGDYCSGRIWSFRYVNGQVTDFRDRSNRLGLPSGLTSFGEDACGELYLVRRSGTIYKLVSGQTTSNDLGFGKVGSNGKIPEFSVCGVLSTGQSAEFRLEDAPPNASAALLVGTTNNPTNFPPIGTFVPIPVLFSAPLVTDQDGKIVFTLPGGTGAITAYAQYALVDPPVSGGVGISNALEIFFQ